MSTSEKRPRTGLIMLLLSIIFIVGVIWLFMYTNQKELERKNERINQEVRKLQEEVSAYITENYDGVKTIEWLGWSVAPKSETPGTVMVINDLNKQYSGNVYFTYYMDENEFQEYTDRRLNNINVADTMANYSELGIIKSENGSPNAKIVYNYEEDK